MIIAKINSNFKQDHSIIVTCLHRAYASHPTLRRVSVWRRVVRPAFFIPAFLPNRMKQAVVFQASSFAIRTPQSLHHGKTARRTTGRKLSSVRFFDQGFTTFVGEPAIQRARFSSAASISRFLLSFGAQLIWGVIRQFFAVSNGLSSRIGSSDTTSSPAA